MFSSCSRHDALNYRATPTHRTRSLETGLVVLCTILGLVIFASPEAHAVADSGGQDLDANAVSSGAQVDLQSGQMALSIPIVIPPGRAQATPSLALAYSTGSGDGPFGLGWSLPIGSIDLNASKGLPPCGGGSQSLSYNLSVAGSSAEMIETTTNQFRMRYDGGYTEAEYHPTSNSWTVRTRDGKRMYFGGAPNGVSDLDAKVFLSQDVLYDSTNCAYTASWALTHVKDPMGNSIEYSYEKIDNVLYPATVEYGGNLDVPTPVAHPFLVTFTNSPRDSSPTRYIHGIWVRQSRQITAATIEAKSSPSGGFQTVRTYGFDYLPDANEGQPYLSAGLALLRKVHTSDFPTRAMHYSDDALGFGQGQLIGAPGGIDELRRYSRLHEQAQRAHMVRTVMDMNGDGFADVVRLKAEGLSGYPMALETASDSWDVYFGSADGTVRHSVWKGTSVADISYPETLRRSTYAEEVTDDRRIYVETMDINGDGVADRVHAGASHWTVNPGSCSQAGATFECEFLSDQVWPSPSSSIQTTTAGTNTSQTLADMNADGLPDLVISGSADDAPWLVYLNTGAGFEATPSDFVAVGPINVRTPQSASFSILPQGFTAPNAFVRELVDFNGDGLPDLVTTERSDPEYPGRWRAVIDANGVVQQYFDVDSPGASSITLPTGGRYVAVLQVRLNNGRSFDPPILSAIAHGYSGFGNSPHWDNPTALRKSTDDGVGMVDLFDVNGDGLPDRVARDFLNDSWRAQLNDGAGGLEDDPVEISGTVLVMHPAYELPGSFGNFSGASQDGEFAYHAITDWDGDGLMDRITSTPDGWGIDPIGRAAGSNQPTRPWLLTKYEDGLGSIMRAQYEPALSFANVGDDNVPDLGLPLWVVTAIRKTDGTCDSGDDLAKFDPSVNPCVASGNESLRRFDYSGGLFDIDERRFRGFAEVVEYDVYDNETVATFSQEGAIAGKLLSTTVYTPNRQHPVERATNKWTSAPPDPDGRTQVWLASSKYERFDLLGEGHSDGVCRISYNRPPDVWGRVSRSCTMEFACGTAPDPLPSNPCIAGRSPGQVDTITVWADPISTEHPVREKPYEITVEYVNDAGTVETLSKQTVRYDGIQSLGEALPPMQVDQGLAKHVESFLDFSHAGPATNPIAVSNYDDFGNLIESRDPRGLVTVIEMDDFSLYPWYESRYGDTVTLETFSTYDYHVGKVKTFIDENAQLTTRAYDSRGRLICEALPGDDHSYCTNPTLDQNADLTATRAFRYFDPDPSAPFPGNLGRVESWNRHDSATWQRIETTAYADAFGRSRLSLRSQQVGDSAHEDVIVSGRKEYDAAGRVAAEYVPYVAPGGVVTEAHVGVPTTYSYELNESGIIDPLGRVGKVDPPDYTDETRTYLGVVSRTENARDDWTDTKVDAFERIIEVSSGASGSGPVTVVTYNHDGAGRVLSEMVNGETRAETKFIYDTLGRVVTKTDPNSGDWRSAYDALGALIFADSPKLFEHVQHQYDLLGRVTKTCSLNTDDQFDSSLFLICGDQYGDEVFEYDNLEPTHHGIGRLWKIAGPNSSTEAHYDQRGRAVWEKKEVLGREAEFSLTFNAAGQPETVTYPDDDVLTYGYRADGMLNTASLGSFAIVDRIEYNEFGEMSLMVRANGVEDSFEHYGHKHGWRLKSIRSHLPGGQTNLDLQYYYNIIGKIYSIDDNSGASGPLSNHVHRIQYDELGRISSHDSIAEGVLDFQFDGFGNLTRPGRTDIIYNQVGHPNQIATIDGSAVEYDANGNRVFVDAHSSFGAAQRYRYDARGRLFFAHDEDMVHDANVFIYDHADQLVYEGTWASGSETADSFYYGDLARGSADNLHKRVLIGDLLVAEVRTFAPEFSTLIFNVPEPAQWMLVSVGCIGLILLWLPRSGRPGRPRGSRALGGVLVVVFGFFAPVLLLADAANANSSPAVGVISHFHFDHVGSTQAITDGAGALVKQVRYDPYGGVRERTDGNGTPISLSDSTREEFGGYISHAETGLQLAGVRIYDPLTGQFLQHDPAGQYTNPYSYGPGDPMNGRDPTGAFFWGLPLWVGVAVVAAGAAVVGYAIYTGVTTGSVGEGFAALFMGLVKLAIAVASIVAAPIAAVAGSALFYAQGFAQIAGLAMLGLSEWDGAIGGGKFGSIVMGLSIGLLAFNLGVGIASEAVSGDSIAEDVTQPPSSDKLQGGNQKFSSDGTTITTTKGATPEQLAEIEAAEARVFGTKHGQRMADRLKAEGRSIEIRVNSAGDNSSAPFSNHVNIDPNNLGHVLTKNGRIPTTLERVLAHEFGHAVFGTLDEGPGNMLNTILNETPIMKELGQPVRIQY